MIFYYLKQESILTIHKTEFLFTRLDTRENILQTYLNVLTDYTYNKVNNVKSNCFKHI